MISKDRMVCTLVAIKGLLDDCGEANIDTVEAEGAGLSRTLISRLREAGLVEHGKYRHVPGPSWERCLMVTDNGEARRTWSIVDLEARVCTLLDTGPKTRQEIEAALGKSGGLARALNYLVAEAYIESPDWVHLTPQGEEMLKQACGGKDE